MFLNILSAGFSFHHSYVAFTCGARVGTVMHVRLFTATCASAATSTVFIHRDPICASVGDRGSSDHFVVMWSSSLHCTLLFLFLSHLFRFSEQHTSGHVPMQRWWSKSGAIRRLWCAASVASDPWPRKRASGSSVRVPLSVSRSFFILALMATRWL
jgi:hypothetical protein